MQTRRRRESSLPILLKDAMEAVRAAEAKVKEAMAQAGTAEEMTVPDIARELGISPPKARQILRRAGLTSIDGRWMTVQRGDDRYHHLVSLLTHES